MMAHNLYMTIALWCSIPINSTGMGSGEFRSIKAVQECREKLMECLDKKISAKCFEEVKLIRGR